MFFKKLINSFDSMFNTDIAIDLGSERTLIYVKDQGIKLDEPTIVAEKYVNGERTLVKCGEEAKKLIGKAPKEISIIRPIKNGAIHDLRATERMLNFFMNQIVENKNMFLRPNPKVLIAVSSNASEVEKKALEDALYEAGAKEVTFIKKGIAAAIGAGLDIRSSKPSCIIDIGANTTEVSVVASSGIIEAQTFFIGSSSIIESVQQHISEEECIEIGVENAEILVHQLATVIKDAVARDNNYEMIKGKSVTNKHIEKRIDQSIVYRAIFKPINEIIDGLDKVFKELPPETVADLSEVGVFLCGGVSKLHGLDVVISNHLNLATHLVNDPALCLINGLGKALEEDIEEDSYEDF